MFTFVKKVAGLGLAAVMVAGLASCGAPASPQTPSASTQEQTVTIKDHWNREVQVTKDPQRVVVMEWEGLVAKSMQMVGVADRIVGVDSSSKKQTFRKLVVPAIEKATDVGSAWSGVNYETLASLRPEVVFLEAWVASEKNRQMHEDVVKKIESLNIPVIVMLSPSNFDKPSLDTAWEHINHVGTLFDKAAETDKIVAQITSRIDDVKARVAKHTGEAPEAAIFATASYVMGEKSIQSFLLTDVLKAKNVAGPGTFVEISEEKLLAMAPEKLIVIGHEGFLSTEKVYGGKKIGIDWSKVATMPAIANKQVTALGYDEWRATIETPIALLKMGKLLYPAEFADVDVSAEEKKYYQDVFGLSADKAAEAISGQQFIGDLKES